MVLHCIEAAGETWVKDRVHIQPVEAYFCGSRCMWKPIRHCSRQAGEKIVDYGDLPLFVHKGLSVLFVVCFSIQYNDGQ